MPRSARRPGRPAPNPAMSLMPRSPSLKARSTCSGRSRPLRSARRAARLAGASRRVAIAPSAACCGRPSRTRPCRCSCSPATARSSGSTSRGDLIGAKPGYATGRPFTALVNLPSRAAVHSQLTAVGRTGKPRRIRCALLAADGPVPGELVIGRVGVRGEADPLMVAVREAASPRREAADDGSGDAGQGPGRDRSRLGAVQAITRRLDLVTAIARLLLENEGFSESRTLQRCARLIVGELTAWVIVDLERRHRVRRQFVLGPDAPGLADLSSALSAVDPQPGSIPCSVHESGRPALIAHVDDPGVLGAFAESPPSIPALSRVPNSREEQLK